MKGSDNFDMDNVTLYQGQCSASMADAKVIYRDEGECSVTTVEDEKKLLLMTS